MCPSAGSGRGIQPLRQNIAPELMRGSSSSYFFSFLKRKKSLRLSQPETIHDRGGGLRRAGVAAGPNLRSEMWGTRRRRDGLEAGECAGHVRRDLSRSLTSTLVWGGQGGSGFFDDGRRRAGVWALGEFGGGEEFGVAAGAVARTQKVEETLLADGDGASCRLQVRGCRLAGVRRSRSLRFAAG